MKQHVRSFSPIPFSFLSFSRHFVTWIHFLFFISFHVGRFLLFLLLSFQRLFFVSVFHFWEDYLPNCPESPASSGNGYCNAFGWEKQRVGDNCG